MKVVITSSEMIKPSCPTSGDRRHLQLSFLDQISHRNGIPLIYCYPSTPAGASLALDRLKTSLSETLSRFYPLAGRLKEHQLFVDCNDQGVPYVEAKVHCQLSQVVGHPNSTDVDSLLPRDLNLGDMGDLLMSIQLNVFDCGGIALSICMSRKIADGASMIKFINCWANITARGGGDLSNMVCPQFHMANIFPPRDMSGYKTNAGTTQEKTVAKRFVFGESAISALRAKYAIGFDLSSRPLTRLEVLMIFLLDRLRAATREEGKPESFYIVTQAINLRTRATPPLPADHTYYGNLTRLHAVVVPYGTGESTVKQGFGFVSQMREAVRNIDNDYIKKLREGNLVLDSNLEVVNNVPEVSFGFSSLHRFPFYEVDFGWGKPIWVTKATTPYKNKVIFMPTRSGLGTEAWVVMEVDTMAKLETDEHFLAFVSPNTGTSVSLPSSM